jgi:hypothetical protein
MTYKRGRDARRAAARLITLELGRSVLSTTGRYLHARPALEQAAVFTRAIEPALGEPGSATTRGAVADSAFELSRGVGLGQRGATN